MKIPPTGILFHLLILLVFTGRAHVRAADLTPLENQKIQYLIATIATLPNARFIRNGTAYDAKSAAEHLRLKLRQAGPRVVTAENFIRFCASGSSVSGSPYQIRFADGSSITSEAFLRQKLRQFEETPDTPEGN